VAKAAGSTHADAGDAARAAIDPLDLYAVRAALSDEERLVQESVARLVDAEVLPLIQRCFEEHRFPKELVPQLASLGLLGSSLTGYGCAGLNAVCYGLICQELERGDSGIRSFVSVQSSLCMYPIWAFGSEEQKLRYLPGMARGELIGCFGLTEPHGGSDPANMKTHAKKRGTDWVLNGSKMWITNGSLADLAVVWAETPEGIRGFLLEKGTPGFSAPEIQHKFSLRASVTSGLFFDNVVVPDERVLPGVRGLKGPLSCLTQARYGIAWGVIGAAQACLKQLLEYTASRTLFGRPLAANQTIQVRLADMARRITTAQLLALQLGRLKDSGAMQPAHVSLAKWNNCRMALDVARDCRDMLGGAGISAEYVPIRHMLNLESVITYEGTETIHQLTIGRELTGLNAF
jgi:glutaryl-CoA dehydrogenase